MSADPISKPPAGPVLAGDMAHLGSHFQLVAETAPVMLWMGDAQGKCVYLNRTLREFWGTGDDISTFNWNSTLHPDDGAILHEPFSKGMQTQTGFTVEARYRRADGSWRILSTQAEPRFGERGEFLGMIGVNEDVTGRREAEEALRREKRLLEMVNQTGAAVAAERDLGSIVQMTTDAGVFLTGAQFGAFFYNVLNEKGESYMLYALSGVPREAFSKFPMPRNTAVFEPTFHGEGIVRSDDILADPRYGQSAPHHGMPPGHLPVRSYLAVPVKSRSGEVLGGLFFGHANTSVFKPEHETLLDGIAGHAATAIDNARLFQSAERELGERRRAEAALRKAKEDRDFLFSLTEQQRMLGEPDAIMQMTAVTVARYMKANRVGFYRVEDDVLTFTPSWFDGTIPTLEGQRIPIEKLGENYLRLARAGGSIVSADTLVPGDTGEKAGRYGARAGIAVPMLRQGEWTSGMYVSMSSPRVWTPEEVALAEEIAEATWDAVERTEAEVALRDAESRARAALEQAVEQRTRELLETEERLRQSQKMEAVGQLTGGIAHDFNNMLAVVIGGLNLLQRRLARGDTDVGQYIEASMDGARRAAALTQRLLAFSRQQPLKPEPVDANGVVAGMRELLARTLGENIRIATVLAPALWCTNADVLQLENVILNLAVNARDAMPDGGMLTIETANAEIGEHDAGQWQIAAGEYVRIAVNDSGLGMSPEVMVRAFDPFFTTKSVGKGTGLGLSQVFGFIRQSGGHVRLQSVAGGGTTVNVYLPRHHGGAGAVPLKRESAVEGGRTGEIVLVVEDEERVRNFSVEALRELGYTVVQAASGAEALNLIDAGQAVTLLFTDVVMPEMTGLQLAERAQRKLPGLKVLYTTGYTRDAAARGSAGVLGNYLPKPFDIEQLAASVRRALDGL